MGYGHEALVKQEQQMTINSEHTSMVTEVDGDAFQSLSREGKRLWLGSTSINQEGTGKTEGIDPGKTTKKDKRT